jgi:hypothetical protein
MVGYNMDKYSKSQIIIIILLLIQKLKKLINFLKEINYSFSQCGS